MPLTPDQIAEIEALRATPRPTLRAVSEAASNGGGDSRQSVAGASPRKRSAAFLNSRATRASIARKTRSPRPRRRRPPERRPLFDRTQWKGAEGARYSPRKEEPCLLLTPRIKNLQNNQIYRRISRLSVSEH